MSVVFSLIDHMLFELKMSITYVTINNDAGSNKPSIMHCPIVMLTITQGRKYPCPMIT